MSDPALSPIYNRLNGTSQYHPFSAETFADWSSEAGDTVQITRDGVTYSAPIHQQTITWHGAHRVTMESGGTKDREATERTSNRKYRNSSGGVSSQKSALKQIRYDFYDNNGALHGLIEVTAQGLTTAFQNADAGLQSQITQEAGRISLVVEGTGANAHIKPASIVAAINETTGQSIVMLDADHIKIGSSDAETVINGKLNVDDLTAELIQSKIAMLDALNVGGIYSSGGIECTEIATSLVSSESLRSVEDINGRTFDNFIVNASVSGNTLTLTKADGTEIPFSKATPVVTLSGAWSGTDFTVTASTGQTLTESFSTEKGSGDGGQSGGLVTIDSYNSSTHKGYARVRTTRTGGGNGVLYRIVADASGQYNNGYNYGYSQGAPTDASIVSQAPVTGHIYNVSVSRITGNAVTVQLDCNTVWQAAYKAGYNQACSDAGISGNTGSVYTGTWYGTLYVAPTGGATAVPNCLGQATGHQLTKKT